MLQSCSSVVIVGIFLQEGDLQEKWKEKMFQFLKKEGMALFVLGTEVFFFLELGLIHA